MNFFRRLSSPKVSTRTIGGFEATLIQKPVKHIYFRIKSPDGKLVVTAPVKAPFSAIENAVVEKRRWIAEKQAHYQSKTPEKAPLGQGSTIYHEGEKLELHIIPDASKWRIRQTDWSSLTIHAASPCQHDIVQLIQSWQRRQLTERLHPIVTGWSGRMDLQVPEYRIKRMRTRWGTCNITAKRIWLNLELIEKPPACLEYVVVHELVHFFERGHNRRFYDFMTHHLPEWRATKKTLENFPKTF